MASKNPVPINRALANDFPVRQRDRFNLELRQTECADLDNGVGGVCGGEVVLAQRQLAISASRGTTLLLF